MTRVHIVALGGTIAMQQAAPGAHASPGAAGRVPSPVAGVEVTEEQVANVGSPSLTVAHVAAALAAAERAVAEGAVGVVLTHGTDTLEETAFLLSRLWAHTAPLVITGAMRPANAAGADGPANLRDAILTATAPSARGLGVLVVFNGMLHLGDRVTKVSSRSVDAFDSVPSGPIGVVHTDDVRLVYRPDAPPLRLLDSAVHAPDGACASGGVLPDALPVVPILGTGLGDDGVLLSLILAADSPVRGVVIDGAGMGHVPAGHMRPIRELLARGIPVVVATRIPDGGTSTYHYAYPGSEVDLISAGAIMAGSLSAHKARLLLQMLIADSDARAAGSTGNADGGVERSAGSGRAQPAAARDFAAAFNAFSYD